MDYFKEDYEIYDDYYYGSWSEEINDDNWNCDYFREDFNDED